MKISRRVAVIPRPDESKSNMWIHVSLKGLHSYVYMGANIIMWKDEGFRRTREKWTHPSVCANNTLTHKLTDRNFQKEKGNSGKNDAEEVWNKESPCKKKLLINIRKWRHEYKQVCMQAQTSAIFVAQVRETPDVSKTDARPANRKQKVEASRPRVTFF